MPGAGTHVTVPPAASTKSLKLLRGAPPTPSMPATRIARPSMTSVAVSRMIGRPVTAPPGPPCAGDSPRYAEASGVAGDAGSASAAGGGADGGGGVTHAAAAVRPLVGGTVTIPRECGWAPGGAVGAVWAETTSGAQT